MSNLTDITKCAMRCPEEYPLNVDWEKTEEAQTLSAVLKEHGFKFLALAVLNGKQWAKSLKTAQTLDEIKYMDEEASAPAWSWNKSRYLETMKAMDELQKRKDATLAALVRWFDGMPKQTLREMNATQILQYLEIQNIAREAREVLGMEIDEATKRAVSALNEEN